MYIKDKLQTSRSIDFLQSRYYKLLSNQKLNSKEAALLADKYDTVSIDKFMVIFPGKTKETLTSLISELRSKERKRIISEEKAGHEIESHKDLKICSLGKLSNYYFNLRLLLHEQPGLLSLMADYQPED